MEERAEIFTMIDGYGRNIDYLRISVTDRCNFRCQYCMPEDGIEQCEHSEMLTFDEIERIVRIMANIGFKKIKITGGEPLVRKNICALIKNINEIEGIESITLTTNGMLLADNLDELVRSGIRGINISLDTLDKSLFKEIARVDALDKVMEGIHLAARNDNINLKINCVPLGLENQDLIEIANLARNNNIHVRFIEMMPIGFGKKFKYISEDEIVSLMNERIGELTPFDGKLGNGPSHYYSVDGFKGKIGFVSALSHKFCSECNRIRLTSTGYLKTCLQYDVGVDLREYLRNGSTDEDIKKAIEKAILAKPMEHSFLNNNIEDEETRPMSKIGG